MRGTSLLLSNKMGRTEGDAFDCGGVMLTPGPANE